MTKLKFVLLFIPLILYFKSNAQCYGFWSLECGTSILTINSSNQNISVTKGMFCPIDLKLTATGGATGNSSNIKVYRNGVVQKPDNSDNLNPNAYTVNVSNDLNGNLNYKFIIIRPGIYSVYFDQNPQNCVHDLFRDGWTVNVLETDLIKCYNYSPVPCETCTPTPGVDFNH